MNKKDDNIIICRCEEITLGEIKQAIRDGARDVTGVKRRTRAGMGLCQGRTCEKLVQQIIKEDLSILDIPTGRSVIFRILRKGFDIQVRNFNIAIDRIYSADSV